MLKLKLRVTGYALQWDTCARSPSSGRTSQVLWLFASTETPWLIWDFNKFKQRGTFLAWSLSLSESRHGRLLVCLRVRMFVSMGTGSWSRVARCLRCVTAERDSSRTSGQWKWMHGWMVSVGTASRGHCSSSGVGSSRFNWKMLGNCQWWSSIYIVPLCQPPKLQQQSKRSQAEGLTANYSNNIN